MMHQSRIALAFVLCTVAACGGRLALDDEVPVDASTESDSHDAHSLDSPVMFDAHPDGPSASQDSGAPDAAMLDATHVDTGLTDARASLDAFSVARCLIGGNVMVVEGDPGEYLLAGSTAVIDSGWYVVGYPSRVWVEAGTWHFVVQSLPLPLAVGVYEDASATVGANLQLAVWNAQKCPDGSTGSFEIDDIGFSVRGADHFTATFDQRCNGEDAALRGCVHYAQ